MRYKNDSYEGEMFMAKTKKEIIKMLINKELEHDDDDYLVDMLADNHISVDIDKQVESNATFGDRVADRLTEVAGSWHFIIGFAIILFIWIILNVVVLLNKFDPYPFILLNLILSCIAALQAPIIMMSQNRQAEKDRLRGQNDYKVDLKAELILEDLHERAEQIYKTQKEIIKQLNEIKENQNK